MNGNAEQLADPVRRNIFRMAAVGGAMMATGGTALMAAMPVAPSPEQAFRAAFDVPPDQPASATSIRMAFLHDQALIIDHGAPFPMAKAAYADHLGFHMANLQRSETLFYDLKVAPHGDSAVVSAYFVERSKPKDAGFRLRAGYCTAVCTRVASGWKALSLHLSPLTSQVIDASPG